MMEIGASSLCFASFFFLGGVVDSSTVLAVSSWNGIIQRWCLGNNRRRAGAVSVWAVGYPKIPRSQLDSKSKSG